MGDSPDAGRNGEAGEAGEQPALELSKSVENLRLPGSNDMVPSSDAATKGQSKPGVAVRAKADALRGYLIEQTSIEKFEEVSKLLRASSTASTNDGQSLQKEANDILGSTSAGILMPMFQLCSFFD